MDNSKLNDLINAINSRALDYLTRAKANKTFVCPICKSGEGKNGTGMSGKGLDTAHPHFTCFAGGCFRNADLLEIIVKERGLTGTFVQKVKQVADILGLSCNPNDFSSLKGETQQISQNQSKSDRFEPLKEESLPSHEAECHTVEAAREENYSEYFAVCADRLDPTEYMTKTRGISKEVCDRFFIGFDPDWRHPSVPPTVPTSQRVIIPTGKSSYTARAVSDCVLPRYRKQKVGKVQIFNQSTLTNETLNNEPLFVVEGEIDALSVMTAGGDAVALGSASNVQLLVEAVKTARESGFSRTMLICADNDEAGKKAAEKLLESLQKIGVDAYSFSLTGDIKDKDGKPCKDANDALVADPDAFSRQVLRGIDYALGNAYLEELEEEEELESESVRSEMEKFLINCTTPKTSYPTGFKDLDRQLNGGLHAGLYGVGAIPSLGKTTFCLQIADNLARTGRDVLIFSLEMSRHELIAKSISRMSYAIHNRDCKEKVGKQEADAVLEKLTTFEVLNAQDFGETKLKTLDKSIREYVLHCADHVFIVEGFGSVRTGHISEKLEKYKTHGKKPVVIVDYLQLLAPDPEMNKASDKQVIDKNVMELKRISRDYDIPVIVISSFNRDAYSKDASLTSFKESGAIEYSADVLLGLQYGDNEKDGGVLSEASKQNIKNGIPIEVTVKVLKNRNGYREDVTLQYVPKFNTYMDKGTRSEDVEAEWEEMY